MSASEQKVTPPRVFISYSQHDPSMHSSRVRAFAEALAGDGLDVELDQYHQHESLDWPRWCEERLRPENSDFVLMICSGEYKKRIEGRVAADKGRGVFWEGSIIDDYLYDAKANERFIPILLDDESEGALPRIVRGWTWFKVSSFGIASGDPGYTNLYRLLTAQPGVVRPTLGERKILPSEPASNPAPFDRTTKSTNLPYPSLGPLFKGREDFINGIRTGFVGNPGDPQTSAARQVVHGLGGIGKTRAAIEYAWRFAADYTALLFISAETPTSFHSNLAALCPILGIAHGVTDDTVRFAAVIEWLRNYCHRGWLLIVDNLDVPEAASAVQASLATLQMGHVLLTGRLSEWPAYLESHRLNVLDRDAAIEFLLARTADGRQLRDNDEVEAGVLADELDGLALALEQAAAFIRRHTLSFSDYLQRWRAADQRVRQWHDARTMQYERPLAATWQTSIDILPPAARSLLDLIAWFAPEPIPRFLFNHAAAPDGLRTLFEDVKPPHEIVRTISGDARAEPESAFAALRDISLLQPAKEVRFPNEGQLHRVVALITRERQSPVGQEASLRSALAIINVAAAGDPEDVRSWPVWDPLRPHAQTLVDFGEKMGIPEPTTELMNDLARLLGAKAQYAEAEPMLWRGLAIDEKARGPADPKVARDLDNLGLLLHVTNRSAAAEPLMRRAVAINEKNFGPQHPNVAASLTNLGLLLHETNQLSEAEPLMTRSLEIFENAFGPNHPSVATAVNNLARLFRGTNRIAQAEPLYRRALAINAEGFGPQHPQVAMALNNLAQLLKATNRMTEAEPLMRRALAINEKNFGTRHPSVANDLNNLGLLLKETNRLTDAEPLYRRALAINEESFGPEHPKVAIVANNLAVLLQAKKQLVEAEGLMRRQLVIFFKFTLATKHHHPHLRDAVANYIDLLKEMELSGERIGERLAEAGLAAGFDAESFPKLWTELTAE